MKKVPTKNYVIVSIICLSTIIIVSYLAYCFDVKNSYEYSNQIMSGFLFEFREDEIINNIENYVLDNPDCILYLSHNGNDTKVFERELRSFIEQNNMRSSLVYINLDTIKNKKFLTEFADKFFSKELKAKNVNMLKQSNILVFKDGVVTDMLYYSKQSINMNDVHLFLSGQGVLND